jgi:hypothetical protein
LSAIGCSRQQVDSSTQTEKEELLKEYGRVSPWIFLYTSLFSMPRYKNTESVFVIYLWKNRPVARTVGKEANRFFLFRYTHDFLTENKKLWDNKISLSCPFIKYSTALYLGTAVASRLPGSSFSPRTFTSLCTFRTLSELPRRASALRPSRSSWLLARRSSRRSSSLRLRE